MKKNFWGSIYIETTVISYLISRPSNNLKSAGEQLITQEWWSKILPNLKPYVSNFVIEEIAAGDKLQSERRLEIIKSFEILQENADVTTLANIYLKELSIPKKSKNDAYHLAIATAFELDFLVSWNCSHIANPFFLKKIEQINNKFTVKTPVICTPREMLGEPNENK